MTNNLVSRPVCRRVTVIPLAGMLMTLAALGLVILVSAQTPPVSVEKTASPAAVFSGDIVKYTAIFSNSSASDVELKVITDTLPDGFTFLAMGGESDIGDPRTPVTATIVWDGGPYPVPAGGTLTLAYNVRAAAPVSPTPYENRVEARLSTGEIISDIAPVHIVGVNLTGSKTANPVQVRVGEPVEFAVTLTNGGTADAVLSAITDTLPAAFTLRQMLSGPLPAPSVQGNDLVWTGPITIAAANQLQFSYEVKAFGIVGQVYHNSVQAAYNGEAVGPYEASISLLPAVVYLPLAVRSGTAPPPPPTYRLAFDTKPGDNFEIYAIDADGTGEVNVSDNEGGDLDPVWSPDGTQIAWVRYYDGKGDIVVANADGSGEINLTDHPKDDRAPDWSPDGTKIVFSSFRNDRWEVYSMDANGQNPTRLTDRECQSHDPLWSPDGSRIAFLCGLDEPASPTVSWTDVFVMNANGSNQVRLTSNEVPDEAPAWSPDSTRLVYVRYDSKKRKDSEIYVVDVTTGVNTRLTNNADTDYSPAWSPDGTKITFSTFLDDSYEIAVMDPDGSNVVNLTNTPLGDYVPRWSPDGKMISFISSRDGNKELYVMDADGSNQVRLTDTAANESNHDWKPR